MDSFLPIVSIRAQVIATRDITEKRVELTKEGVDFVENGSAEFRTFERVAKEGGTPQTDIMVSTLSREEKKGQLSPFTAFIRWFYRCSFQII